MIRFSGIVILLFPFFLWAEERFYLYQEGIEMGVPSGYFGSANGKSIRVLEFFDKNPQSGKYSMSIQMNGTESYGGFFILSSGHWRSQLSPDSHFEDLSDYKELSFWGRSDQATTATVGVGEEGEDKVSFTVTLTSKWEKFSFYIGDADYSSLNGLFFISLQSACHIQLDEIYFSKGKKDNLSFQFTTEQNWIPVKTEIRKNTSNSYSLLRDGKPYYINGVGFQKNMHMAKLAGANSIRIWGHESAKAALDSAYKNGMTVMLGLWLQHERHGFNYDDEEAVKYQIIKFKEVVNKFKDHPALLLWGIGNELDLFYTNKKVWNTVQEIARYIHEVDPNHPTSTVTAGLDTTEIPLIQTMCPDIDIFGVNSYADVHLLSSWFRKGGLTRPYVVTEWGPTGNWECPKTTFGIGIEETSGEKAARYAERYRYIRNDSAMCIGSYVFFWGNKQETTPTWFGIFMPDGRTLSEAADALQYNWTNVFPTTRAPHLSSISIEGKKSAENIVLKPSQVYQATVVIEDPEKERLEVIWEIMPESTKAGTGGDWEETPEAIPELLIRDSVNELEFKAPEIPGPYRLFYYAKDPSGKGAYANVVFWVE